MRESEREWKASPMENSVILSTADTQLPPDNSFFCPWSVFSGTLQGSPGEANKCWILHRSIRAATKLEILVSCTGQSWQDRSWLVPLQHPASLHSSFWKTCYLRRDGVRSGQASVIPKVIYPILIPKRTNIFLFLNPAFHLSLPNQCWRVLTGWTTWKFP